MTVGGHLSWHLGGQSGTRRDKRWKARALNHFYLDLHPRMSMLGQKSRISVSSSRPTWTFFLLALPSLKGVSTSPVVSFSPIAGRLLACTPSTQVLVLWTPWSPQSMRVRVPGCQAVCGINPGARACSTAERNSPASFSVTVTCVCAQWALPSRGAGRTSTQGPGKGRWARWRDGSNQENSGKSVS